jgi:hypothetical protein
VEVGSVLLITIGVMGELGAGIEITSINAVLRGKSAELRSKNADLRSKSDQLLALVTHEAGEAKKRASENEEEAAQLRKDAEDERIARVKIEEDVTWRRLTSKERGILSEKLNPFSQTAAVVEYSTSDTEAYAFGVDIAKALSEARWTTTDPHDVINLSPGPFAFGTSPRPPTGIELQVCPNDWNRNGANALHDALIALGFDVAKPSDNCEWAKKLNPPVPNPRGILVSIRPRPEGPQGAAKLRHEEANNKHKTASK